MRPDRLTQVGLAPSNPTLRIRYDRSGMPRAQTSKLKQGHGLAEARAFSSEVDTGSRQENASRQEAGASVLIPSEPKL